MSFPKTFIETEPSHFFEWMVVAVSIVVLAIIIIIAYRRYAIKQCVIPAGVDKLATPVRIVHNKFYVDELYDAIIVRPLESLSRILYSIVDIRIIDGIVNGISKTVMNTSGLLRRFQTGYVGFYIFAMVFGIIAILFFNIVIK